MKAIEIFEDVRFTARVHNNIANVGEISRYNYKKVAEMIEDFKYDLDWNFELDIITKEQWVKDNSVYHLMKRSLATAKIQ